MSKWVAVEEALPARGEHVAVWLEGTDDGLERHNLVFARLTAAAPAPLWRDATGGVYGDSDQKWRVTHWSRVNLAA